MGGRGSGGSRNGGGSASKTNSSDWAKTASGQWDIDVAGKGGAQILEGKDLYSGDKTFEVHMWDKDYKILPTQVATDLSKAKSIVKDKLDVGKVKTPAKKVEKPKLTRAEEIKQKRLESLKKAREKRAENLKK